MTVTKEYLEERHAYWVKRIGDACIWDTTLFKPVAILVRKRSKVYNGRFIRKWVKISSTLMELRDTIILYQQYPEISKQHIDSNLIQIMIFQYLQQNDLENLGCHGRLFTALVRMINNAFGKEIYVEGI